MPGSVMPVDVGPLGQELVDRADRHMAAHHIAVDEREKAAIGFRRNALFAAHGEKVVRRP